MHVYDWNAWQFNQLEPFLKITVALPNLVNRNPNAQWKSQ